MRNKTLIFNTIPTSSPFLVSAPLAGHRVVRDTSAEISQGANRTEIRSFNPPPDRFYERLTGEWIKRGVWQLDGGCRLGIKSISGGCVHRRTGFMPCPILTDTLRISALGAVAQRSEQRTHNPLVLGSNPSSPIAALPQRE